MEQIQKHEWKATGKYSWLYECSHCGNERITDYNMEARFFYRDKARTFFVSDEPACITRYPEWRPVNNDTRNI